MPAGADIICKTNIHGSEALSQEETSLITFIYFPLEFEITLTDDYHFDKTVCL